jgi:putative restriction endonuclease
VPGSSSATCKGANRLRRAARSTSFRSRRCSASPRPMSSITGASAAPLRTGHLRRSRNSLACRPPSLQRPGEDANLDGSRSHGARWDARVGAILREEQSRFAHVYRTLLAAARAEGIASDRLPDFLHLENGGELTLLGQDELGPAELDRLLTDADPGSDVLDLETERIVVGQARVNQHLFAQNVLRNCGSCCVFCGLKPSVFGGRRMFFAGHIKPWRDSSPKERLDVRNGLAACPAHDIVFDNGLMTVDLDFSIRVAPALAAAIESDERARHFYGSPPLSQALILPATAQLPGSKYLGWHRKRVFVGLTISSQLVASCS